MFQFAISQKHKPGQVIEEDDIYLTRSLPDFVNLP